MRYGPSGYSTRRFSNVGQRDGFGLELIDGVTGDVVAEVFASDLPDACFTVTTYGESLPVTVMEWFIARAREQIGSFTDGRALPALGGGQPDSNS